MTKKFKIEGTASEVGPDNYKLDITMVELENPEPEPEPEHPSKWRDNTFLAGKLLNQRSGSYSAFNVDGTRIALRQSHNGIWILYDQHLNSYIAGKNVEASQHDFMWTDDPDEFFWLKKDRIEIKNVKSGSVVDTIELPMLDKVDQWMSSPSSTYERQFVIGYDQETGEHYIRPFTRNGTEPGHWVRSKCDQLAGRWHNVFSFPGVGIAGHLSGGPELQKDLWFYRWGAPRYVKSSLDMHVSHPAFTTKERYAYFSKENIVFNDSIDGDSVWLYQQTILASVQEYLYEIGLHNINASYIAGGHLHLIRNEAIVSMQIYARDPVTQKSMPTENWVLGLINFHQEPTIQIIDGPFRCIRPEGTFNDAVLPSWNAQAWVAAYQVNKGVRLVNVPTNP